MRIAITGSTGHIAAALIPLLIEKGYSIRALVHEKKPGFNSSSVEIIQGNILQASTLPDLVSGCDVVIHTAAKISINSDHDPSVYAINVTGTKNIFTAAKYAEVKRFIHISSIHAYQQYPRNELLNETRQYCSDKAHLYDRSKRDAEKFVLENASAEMETVVLNPTAVVGPPDQQPSLMGQAMIDMYNNKLPALVNGGFDFCDVRDVAEGILNSIHKGRNANTYLLSGEWMHLSVLHQLIMDMKGQKRNIPVLPGWTAYMGLPFIRLFARLKNQPPLYSKESLDALLLASKNISSKKATEELGYRSRPLLETFTDCINWYKQAGMI